MSIKNVERWKRGWNASDKFAEGLVFTPKYMMRGLNYTQWIDYKKQQTAKEATSIKTKKPF